MFQINWGSEGTLEDSGKGTLVLSGPGSALQGALAPDHSLLLGRGDAPTHWVTHDLPGGLGRGIPPGIVCPLLECEV